MPGAKPTVFVWDFDGTLVDSRYRNLQVTRAIYSELTGRSPDELEALRSSASYDAAHRDVVNWRRFYGQHLGLDREMTDEAARRWAAHQLRDRTPTPVFPGIDETLANLGGYPHGIVSQNARANILRLLEETRLARHFDAVVGYEEVPLARQKPDPQGMLMCVDELTQDSTGCVFFVGDHETDLETAVNANRAFEKSGADLRVMSILAAYSPTCDDGRLAAKADFVASRASEIVEIAQRFES